MTTMTVHSTTTGNDDGNSYDAGYTDGELDAITGFPKHLAEARASMAAAHDHLWAQGYWDGYLHQAQVVRALEFAEHKARTAATRQHPSMRNTRQHIDGAA